ncbi:MAG: MarR family winged helix-turn-helix transcriptional regulator [Thermaurantiacus sp.]
MAQDSRLVLTLRQLTERLRAEVYGGMANKGFPDVRPAHSAVLRNLPPEGARIVELAEDAGMTKQSMAYLVSGLEAQGLVQIAPDPSDGRARIVTLTSRGELAVRALIALSRDAERRLAEGMGEDRVRVLRMLSEQALQSMKDRDGYG